jgi:imidazole glycerol-phosphate synthase subunit HisF
MSGFRIIPSLLLKDKGLVKGINFSNYKYVGDPINTVRIFNDKEVDELFFFDISATEEKREISFSLIKKLANECFMPFAVGGGINSIEYISKLIKLGVEKVSINTHAVENPDFISESAGIFGSQAIVVSIDVKKSINGNYNILTHSGKKHQSICPLNHAKLMEQKGAGELILNSIDNDGTQNGYDKELIKMITDAVNIPVIAGGGAGELKHFVELYKDANVSAATGGSFFVFHGKLNAVLISYPTKKQLSSLL